MSKKAFCRFNKKEGNLLPGPKLPMNAYLLYISELRFYEPHIIIMTIWGTIKIPPPVEFESIKFNCGFRRTYNS